MIEENIYFDELATKRAVGQKIREFRLSRGVSRLKLGILIGVSDHQIMKYELGQDNVSASILWKICSVLRCPVDSFFILPETGPIGSEPPGCEPACLDDQAVLAAFRQISPPEVRQRVARLILTLAAQGADAEADGPEV
ncbi:DNA-binding transcriptional regulator, XRE-family HTH domain [Methylobacterium sp. 174MFSha1.1]|uniref:helix-turn-helix domain-containing protein n=1 Tax=Methylobacterium sp. 174MFSha1.1 TaxID=1502749 RepID=UPI0008E35D64|nr:helix-turn-helix transcriptional regulator [Methylobacterium sp. 174MFSha1.1]SFU66889.1 DNA-binding transcriptional regulator, XRE-family HTH domain [Methylobacterium sp. 174MFSha1.1]